MLEREVLLAGAYALLLLAFALALEAAARRVERAEGARWPQSDAAQLRRGLALVLVVLASALLAVEAFRHPRPRALAALGGGLVLALGLGARSARPFLARPD